MFSILILLLFTVGVYATPSKTFWQDENGCSYCLHGTIKYGECVKNKKKETWNFLFDVKKGNNNQCQIFYGYKSSLQVFCKDEKNYCKTINDSMVVKAMPSLKERKDFCNGKKDLESKYYSGMLYGFPVEEKINKDNVSFLCDFVSVDYEKSTLKITDKGICPVWVTVKPNVLYVYHLNISKKKRTYDFDLKRILVDSFEEKSIIIKDFISIGKCKKSTCEILNYHKGSPQDFSIDCDFMEKSKSSPSYINILGEGICPIEFKNEAGKTSSIYIRSVKTDDGYKALITNKSK